MAKSSVVIQPGPIFYEVFVGALMARGQRASIWASSRGLRINNLKPMATGATNGARSRAIRDAMLKEVGEETFRALYEARLRNDGLLT